MAYTEPEGNTVTVTWRGAGAEAFTRAARAVMLAAQYEATTVNVFIPTPDREWAYVDEQEEQ